MIAMSFWFHLCFSLDFTDIKNFIGGWSRVIMLTSPLPPWQYFVVSTKFELWIKYNHLKSFIRLHKETLYGFENLHSFVMNWFVTIYTFHPQKNFQLISFYKIKHEYNLMYYDYDFLGLVLIKKWTSTRNGFLRFLLCVNTNQASSFFTLWHN